ncbi:hypothetical protein COS83_01000 [archaeon CG07_land_8_20_14_0_80_38_8]|nr:MAG: hypothetical protein COS83_01000 [archaeon CG07_land_8_20_14_0_80_38_8]PIU88234.1 MAG: hypothetical protein COS64_04320 [archaeon CG06_land_8_20_14_3_00_37_11]
MLLKLKNEYNQKLEKHNNLINESKQLLKEYEETKDEALKNKYLTREEETKLLEKELTNIKKSIEVELKSLDQKITY